jgi:hypothetical protein
MARSRWIRRLAVGVVAVTGAALAGACGPQPVAGVDDIRVAELAVPAVFTVTLSRTPSGPVSVRYSTANGTATAPADYTATSGTLTFAAGQTRRTVSAAVVPDALPEDDETFRLVLSAPSGVTIGDGSGTATVVDND